MAQDQWSAVAKMLSGARRRERGRKAKEEDFSRREILVETQGIGKAKFPNHPLDT